MSTDVKDESYSFFQKINTDLEILNDRMSIMRSLLLMAFFKDSLIITLREMLYKVINLELLNLILIILLLSSMFYISGILFLTLHKLMVAYPNLKIPLSVKIIGILDLQIRIQSSL